MFKKVFKNLLGRGEAPKPDGQTQVEGNLPKLGGAHPIPAQRRRELDKLARAHFEHDEMMRRQQMATTTPEGIANMRDAMRNAGSWPTTHPSDPWASGNPNPVSANPKEKGWALEDMTTEELSKILNKASTPMREKMLGDMCLSNSRHQRMFAAVHEETPIVSITMHLQADKDERVKYLAQCRVETEGE